MYQNECPSREELARMVMELSDDALSYVRMPILCAYYFTDMRDPNRLTDEDSARYSMVGIAANESLRLIRILQSIQTGYNRAEIEKRLAKKQGAC